MSRPTDAGAFAETVYEQMVPVAYDDENQDWALLRYLGGLGQMFQQMDTLAHSNPPWSMLVNIDEVPAEGVSWLGQFVGTKVDTSLIENEQRQQVRTHEGWNRGTVLALAAAIRSFLTGARTIQIRERKSSAYNLQVVTFTEETPIGDTYQTFYDKYLLYQEVYDEFFTYRRLWNQSIPNLINNILQTKKAAGLNLTYTVNDAADYWNLWNGFATYQEIYFVYSNLFPTYQSIYDWMPTEDTIPKLFIFTGQSIYTSHPNYEEVLQLHQTFEDVMNINRTY